MSPAPTRDGRTVPSFSPPSRSSSRLSSTSSLVSASVVPTAVRPCAARQVEPAAAARAAGGRAELVAAIAQMSLADLGRRARSGTGPRRRASCRPWRCRSRARSRRADARRRCSAPPTIGLRRGHVRIRAVVDVEQRPCAPSTARPSCASASQTGPTFGDLSARGTGDGLRRSTTSLGVGLAGLTPRVPRQQHSCERSG